MDPWGHSQMRTGVIIVLRGHINFESLAGLIVLHNSNLGELDSSGVYSMILHSPPWSMCASAYSL